MYDFVQWLNFRLVCVFLPFSCVNIYLKHSTRCLTLCSNLKIVGFQSQIKFPLQEQPLHEFNISIVPHFPPISHFPTAHILIVSFVTLLKTSGMLHMYFLQIEYGSSLKDVFLFQLHRHQRHDGLGAGEEGGAHGGDVERALQPQHLQLLLCRRRRTAHHQVLKGHATLLVFHILCYS